LYPPLRNVAEGVYFAKGGNVLKYKAKENALLKLRSSYPSTTLTLQSIQMSEHKHKKEKTLPLEICDKLEKDFIVIHKKYFTKHGGQVIKQVSKPKRIFERPALSKPITLDKSQHSGIGSHLFYLNLQHCTISLSFNKI